MIKFIRGEDKHVKFRVHSAKGGDMIVESAKYTFLQYGKVETAGECALSNDGENPTIDVKLYPENIGPYLLEITYQVADETLKHREDIQVI